jgi:hypothetical protein
MTPILHTIYGKRVNRLQIKFVSTYPIYLSMFVETYRLSLYSRGSKRFELTSAGSRQTVS